jgi:predicted amidohydrolase
METITVALWATNLEIATVNLASWIAAIDTRMAEAKAGGAELLVMPEFACSQWLSFAPPDLRIDQQIPWLAALTPVALDGLRLLPPRHGIALLAGTMPFAEKSNRASSTPRHFNRAFLLLPDGRVLTQDKLCLTPSEQNTAAWCLTPGAKFNVMLWNQLRIAVVICLDVEFTSLFARLGKLDLDLILVPAKTGLLSGYYRVFGCAKARAIELQTVVCVVGAIGSALAHPNVDTVMGGAAAFLPCEHVLGSTGIAAALEPHAAASGLSPLLYAHNLPVGYCRKMRHGAAEAEVWPSAWTADHVRIVDSAAADRAASTALTKG